MFIGIAVIRRNGGRSRVVPDVPIAPGPTPDTNDHAVDVLGGGVGQLLAAVGEILLTRQPIRRAIVVTSPRRIQIVQ
jgi:hypothetical protein